MPRVRFTVRRMMLAVAVAGVLAFGVEIGNRQQRLAKFALHHAESETVHKWSVANAGAWLAVYEKEAAESGDGQAYAEDIANCRYAARVSVRLAAYHAAMKAKYARAARYPWLPVAPDPPEPK